jgi:hypothetical protein
VRDFNASQPLLSFVLLFFELILSLLPFEWLLPLLSYMLQLLPSKLLQSLKRQLQ